jgi:hypothetical protein
MKFSLKTELKKKFLLVKAHFIHWHASHSITQLTIGSKFMSCSRCHHVLNRSTKIPITFLLLLQLEFIKHAAIIMIKFTLGIQNEIVQSEQKNASETFMDVKI